ncbi:MAG: universal stress protein [Gammaproteobacteria bacterium]|nr:universal stress protein [Gammaproteobacteria bacterium]
MYKKIMVPVDLSHADTVEKSIKTARDLSKIYDSEIYLVGVTATAPGSVAHDPAEYEQKLKKFAADHSSNLGCTMIPKVVICNDPAVELDEALEKCGREINVDLVVMASHVPGFMDHLFHSKAGHLAMDSKISVFIVR